MKTKQTDTNPHAAGEAAPYAGHLERGPDRIYTGPAIRLDLAGYGGAVELGFVGCTMAERPDDYAAFIVRACNAHAGLVEALLMAQERITELSRFAGLPDEGQTQDEIRAALSSAQS